MPVFSSECLSAIGYEIFRAAGAPEDEAHIVADSLVGANLAGHDSHGVIRIPSYIQALVRGMVEVPTHLEMVRETATTAVIDANWGFGQVAAARGMSMAIERARQNALASITIRQTNHIGRVGEYAELAAVEGLIGLVTANNHGTGLIMAPWGGRERRLSPNPMAIGIPTGTGRPVLLDMSASVSAEGKLRVKRNQAQSVPEGWIIDHEGRPSTDPNDFYGDEGKPGGAILPLGGSVGYKGFGLGFVLDILGGALSGAGCSGTPDARIGNGVFMLAMDVEAFAERADFDRMVGDFIDHVKASARMPGVEEILIPGEIENRSRREREEKGIPVDEVTWGQIIETAKSVGYTPGVD